MPTTPPPNPAGSPDDRSLSIDTVVVRSGRPPAEPGQPLNQPIVPASAFHGGGSIENSTLIDLDGEITNQDKTALGDVEIPIPGDAKPVPPPG